MIWRLLRVGPPQFDEQQNRAICNIDYYLGEYREENITSICTYTHAGLDWVAALAVLLKSGSARAPQELGERAAVAVARKLAVLMQSMLRTGEAPTHWLNATAEATASDARGIAQMMRVNLYRPCM
ncbi:hypothetical protein ILFOPFJJ_06023 [Ensifer psoraleae]|nr:hypothetical protein [Sinorhizobium psoraleae]